MITGFPGWGRAGLAGTAEAGEVWKPTAALQRSRKSAAAARRLAVAWSGAGPPRPGGAPGRGGGHRRVSAAAWCPGSGGDRETSGSSETHQPQPLHAGTEPGIPGKHGAGSGKLPRANSEMRGTLPATPSPTTSRCGPSTRPGSSQDVDKVHHFGFYRQVPGHTPGATASAVWLTTTEEEDTHAKPMARAGGRAGCQLVRPVSGAGTRVPASAASGSLQAGPFPVGNLLSYDNSDFEGHTNFIPVTNIAANGITDS